MSDQALLLRVSSLYATYARLIDDARFDDWLELFAEPCQYRVSPRENVARGLPLPLVLCPTKDALRDRIVSLQHANIYNVHVDRHVIGNVTVVEVNGKGIEAEADFAVFQTDQEGETRVFAVGRYTSRLTDVAGALRFACQHAIVDTASLKPLLATPL